MDQIKIGNFIADMRKAKNITQKQLAEQLGISDRTVSKWECGNGMPEVSMMLPLCEILEINVNELLSGERLSQNDYHNRAEENMIHLVQEKEKINKNRTKTSMLSMLLILAVVLLLMIILSVYTTGPSVFYWEYLVDGPDLLAMAVVTTLLLLITGQLKYFGKAFAIVCGKSSIETSEEKKKICDTLVFVEKLLWCIGIVIVTVYLIIVLYNVAEPATIGPNLAVAIGALLYSALGNLILLPIKSLVESKVAEE